MLDLIEPFILLLVIMDPVLGVSTLISLTKDKKDSQRMKIAIKSVSVSAFVFLLFAFGGNIFFKILGVNINSFKAAGGIILIIMGIQLALGISFPKEKEEKSEIAVVIGTPLISGPATITTTMILIKDIGLINTLIAGIAALFAILISLLLAIRINKIIGRGGMQVLSTMMGIVTIAWGIQFLITGLLGFY